MIKIDNFIQNFSQEFAELEATKPWEITQNLPTILSHKITQLDDNYTINQGIAIHKTAVIEQGVVLKAPIIIAEDCFISAYSYLRGGVYLGNSVKIGPSCEIKSSIICSYSALAHFNFIGDSIVGNHVNFEAGALIANHFNEREDKKISILLNTTIIDTQVQKFGALIGDYSRIGANAVLSPGTILDSYAIVKRLELIEQVK